LTAVAVGVDLGGTNCRACLIDDRGRRTAERQAAFGGRDLTAEGIVALIARLVGEVRRDSIPIGVGVGVAGIFNDEGSMVRGMTNLPVLAGFALVPHLEAALQLPVRLENDARVAMLGEARLGAARGKRDALTITLGTGIGGGLMLDGRIRRGFHNFAGEIGLTRVPRPAGVAELDWVALEDVASPGGLRRTAGLSIEQLAQEAHIGRQSAIAALERIFSYLAAAITNAYLLLDLEMVVLAGEMAKMGQELLAEIKSAAARFCPPELLHGLQIELAQLGDWGGATGAACLWLGNLGAAMPALS